MQRMVDAPPAELERLRVVQVIPVLAVGGLERMAVTLTLALADRVERIVVCSYRGDAFREPLHRAGVPVELIPRPRPTPPAVVRAALALAPILRRERPDVVHAHNPGAAAAAALARKLARLPSTAIVASYHGVEGSRVARAAKVLRRAADVVVAIAPAAADDLRRAGLEQSPLEVVYNGVRAAPSRARHEMRRELDANGAELLVSVGRYAEEKNQELLIDAIALLSRRRPALRALLVGDGPLEEQLRASIHRQDLGSVVRLTGPRLDVADVLGAADVFALSSAREGMPVALLEALDAGVPAVSTAVGGVVDVVGDGETALLVPPGDRAALAGAIERVLEDEDLRARLSREGRKLVRAKFSAEAMVDGYCAVYLSAVAGRARCA